MSSSFSNYSVHYVIETCSIKVDCALYTFAVYIVTSLCSWSTRSRTPCRHRQLAAMLQMRWKSSIKNRTCWCVSVWIRYTLPLNT